MFLFQNVQVQTTKSATLLYDHQIHEATTTEPIQALNLLAKRPNCALKFVKATYTLESDSQTL